MLRYIFYKLSMFSKVEKNRERTVIETDISYKSSIIRQSIFLFLFGSGLISIFLSGISKFLLYYGIIALATILLYGISFPIFLPELSFARILGYNIDYKVSTNWPHRYKTTIIITKKSRGLFRTESSFKGGSLKGVQYGMHVNPKSYIQVKKGEKYLPWYVRITLRVNNALISFRALSIFIMSLIVFLFSFFPIVNVCVILMLLYSLIWYGAVQWKGDTIINKMLIVISWIVFVACILAAIIIYMAIFIR